MESRVCMNSCCRASCTVQWKKGWPTKSGDPALLCFNCGSAYDNLLYCDTFHAQQSGWRECSLCNKRLHCGCSASLPFLHILDFGGVSCITCLPTPPPPPISLIADGISSQPQPQPQPPTPTTYTHTNPPSSNMPNRPLLHFPNTRDNILPRFLPHAPNTPHGTLPMPSPPLSTQPHSDATNTSKGTLPMPPNRPPLSTQPHTDTKDTSQGSVGITTPALITPLLSTQPTQDQTIAEGKIMQGPQLPSSNMSRHSPAGTSNAPLSFSNGAEEDKSRSIFTQSGQKRHLFPKPPKTNPAKALNATKTPSSPTRVARPPAEGRLRNQLLPRYWPRITDQELQKLSGDLNTAIVPLFEKILSASDASRIGRLVLPKACAEAYFPPINQSEGLPLKIQDVKGNEWTFQFRFWPNNNSRMYVLEGVTPCIQSMQLQAGDTVTFSRIDPGGKLVIGYRKASNTLEIQDSQTSLANSSSPPSGECLYAGVTDGLAAGNVQGIQPPRGQDDHPDVLPGQLEMVKGESVLNKCEKLSIKNENALQQPELTPEKKRTRNISSKSKRLIMHNEDAIVLRLSWEETQELLRPPPSLEPNIVMVEDIEFEEYSEPPVFGKRTYFTSWLCGVQDQWAQCDKCSKWRKLPADVLLPPMWTCLENVWDSSRSSCDTLEEMSSKELEIIFRINKDFKKGKAAESTKLGQGCEHSGLDALATAATLSDHAQASGGATTRHPRHRPGCSCIVCIQPPSGKGKHKSSCVCNVCLTVKRRFKTLMMRKKKRQGEREAELALQKSHDHPIKKPRLLQNASTDCRISDKVCLENDFQENLQSEDQGHIDLNCHPIREEEAKRVVRPNTEMMNLNELTNLLPKQPTDDGLSSKEQCYNRYAGAGG